MVHRRVSEVVDSLMVLVVVVHKMVSGPVACKLVWEAYTKVWAQVDLEKEGHRRASDQVEHRKASLEVPYLREQHRWASYQGAEEAFSWEHWHYMVEIPEEASLAGSAVEEKAF